MPQRPSLSRSELRKKEYQTRISNAAIELFVEHGVEATTIKQIVSSAGVAHKTFFNHFPTKSHLLTYISSIYGGFTEAIFENCLQLDVSAREKLFVAFAEVAEGLLSIDERHVLMLKEILNGVGASPEESRLEQFNMVSGYVSKILHEARDEDTINPALPLDHYIDNVTQLFISTILIWCSVPGISLKARMRRTLEFIDASVFVH